MMLRMPGPTDAVFNSLHFNSLCPGASNYNLCQVQPSRVYYLTMAYIKGHPLSDRAHDMVCRTKRVGILRRREVCDDSTYRTPIWGGPARWARTPLRSGTNFS